MFFVDKWVHSNSLFNVQPEENKVYPTVMPSYGNSKYGMSRKKNFLESMNRDAAPMWRFLCAMQLNKCLSVGGRKKIGVDWPRPSRFRKISPKSYCSNWKIGVDRSRESQKGPIQRQVSFVFFRTGHPGIAEAFCTSMACPWQEV